MATLGGGEGGRGNIHRLSEESSLQHSFPVDLRGRRRLNLSFGMGNSQSQIRQGKIKRSKMLRLRTSISGWDDGEAGGVPSKRHRGVGVDLHQCFSSHLQNVRVGQTSPKFADGKVRNYELGTHGSWEEFHEY